MCRVPGGAKILVARKMGREQNASLFTAVKRKKQENYFKDEVFIFTVQSLILNKYSPNLLNFLELC